MMWQFCADHEQKQELGDETITRGLDTTRPITEALRGHSRQRASCEVGQTVRTSQVHDVSELIKQHAPDAGEAGLRRWPAGLPFSPAWRMLLDQLAHVM